MELVKNVPAALVSSEVGLRFASGFHSQTNVVNVQYRVKLTDALSGSDYADFSEGLTSETVVMGTVARLLAGKELPNVSEDARTGQSDVGAFIGVGNAYQREFEILLSKLSMELMSSIPPTPDQNYLPGWW
jgi:hypothetical protein